MDGYIQPIVDMDDKKAIGNLIGSFPEDLQRIGGINHLWPRISVAQSHWGVAGTEYDFVDLNLSDNQYWEVGCNKVVDKAVQEKVLSNLNRVVSDLMNPNFEHLTDAVLHFHGPAERELHNVILMEEGPQNNNLKSRIKARLSRHKARLYRQTQYRQTQIDSTTLRT